MNYIKQLAGFFDQVAGDERLNPTHISMYVSLFQMWNTNRFQNPISIARSELMQISKISARGTYHKCLKELHSFGYIKYMPSYNPLKGSRVYLFNFQPGKQTKIETGTEQVLVRSRTKIETSSGQVVVPFINNIKVNKQKKSVNGSKGNLRITSDDPEGSGLPCGQFTSEELGVGSDDVRVTNEGQGKTESKGIPESLDVVRAYFKKDNHDVTEAEKFYNYFSSKGWLVGGRTTMRDWQAAARNWMLNIKSYSIESTRASKTGGGTHLHTTTNKNYNEPL